MPKLPIPAPNTVGPTVRSAKSKRRKAKARSSKVSVPAKPTVKRQDPIFASALNVALERYQKAINERARYMYLVGQLNLEIPALEDSMRTLNNLLHPELAVTYSPQMAVASPYDISQEQAEALSYQPPMQRAIAEALPLPPRTVPSNLAAMALKQYGPGVAGGSLKGMGSIPAAEALKGRGARRSAAGPVAVADPLEQPLDGAEIAGDLEVQEVS